VDGVRARDWATVDFYAVLGVPPTASADEIGLAFRALAKQLHPDRVGASASDSERFKSVTAAYDVLGDDRLRRSYDQVRSEEQPRRRIATGVAPRAAAPDSDHPVRTTEPTPEVARRGARRWIAGGVAVLLVGILAAALVAHLQIDERARRAGRV
jgi:curved DNA-binding protein CbpA